MNGSHRLSLTLHLMKETLRSVIDNTNSDQFLPMLSILDQDNYISSIPPLDRHHPMFSWIFRNIDFTQWRSSKCSQVLWLSGPAKCNVHQASSYIVGQQKTDHFVLYFFCSGGITTGSSVVHTLLNQIVSFSPVNKHIIIQRFLHSLLGQAFQKGETSNGNQRHLSDNDPPDTAIKKILQAPIAQLWIALGVVLCNWEQREVSIVIDGLEHVEHQRSEFIKGVRAFVDNLQQRTSKVKVLLTSRPLAEIKDLFDGLLCIEHDKERKGLSAPHILIIKWTDLDEQRVLSQPSL